jgi:hypothetical protein
MNDKPDAVAAGSLEQQIGAWREHLRRRRTLTGSDVAELEDHLREQIASLRDQLSEDEAFLVAVKRMGAIDALTREFAREQSDRLWKQLVLSGDAWEGGGELDASAASRRMRVALALAVGAGAAIKLPSFLGIAFDDSGALFYLRNVSFFILPFLAAYFAWERPVPALSRYSVAGVFALGALVVNVFPFDTAPGGSGQPGDTMLLTALHLPIALWVAAVGVAYVGGRWRGNDRRMDFVRFTGELYIYYVLIALGGGVLIGLTFALFEAIGVDVELVVQSWIMPCGVAGAALVATWLVEAKQSVIENIAPVLTRIFTPLFALVLLAFLTTMVATGRGIDVEREVLIAFDLLLVVVFALLLYSISARDPHAAPGVFDWIQLTLVVTALIVDLLALWAIGGRISSFGSTPNRVAALGENIVLLVNLTGAAFLYARFLRGRVAFSSLTRWQTFYLYVFAAWAAIVAFVFPPLFGFR